MTRIIALVVAVVALAAVAGSVYAQGAAAGAAPAGPMAAQPRLDIERLLPNPGAMEGIAGQLGLTPEQKAALRNLAAAKSQQVQPLRQQLVPLHKQLVDLMLANSLDVAKAKELTDQIMGLRTQIAKAGLEFWAGVRSQLTPEQNAKLTQILKDRFARGQGMSGGAGGQGGQRQPGMNAGPKAGAGNRQRVRPNGAGGGNRVRTRPGGAGAAANP